MDQRARQNAIPNPHPRLLRSTTPLSLLKEVECLLVLTERLSSPEVSRLATHKEALLGWSRMLPAARANMLSSETATWNDDWRDAAAMVFVVECLVRLALAEHRRLGELPDGCAGLREEACELPPSSAAVLLKHEVAGEFDPQPGKGLLERGLRGCAPQAALNADQIAYAVSINDETSKKMEWLDICAIERVTAHARAECLLEQLVAAMPVDAPVPEWINDAARGERARAWHAGVVRAQLSDEFLVQVTDDLIRIHMSEVEVYHPETIDVFTKTKPRAGYLWYTRLRAARAAEDVNRLHNECTAKVPDMANDMRTLTLDVFLDYHMRHAGAVDWRAQCSFRYNHSFEALRAVHAARRVRIGVPNRPPLLLLLRDGCTRLVDTVRGQQTILHTFEDPYGAVEAWAEHLQRQRRSMLGPRVNVEPLLCRLLAPISPAHDNSLARTTATERLSRAVCDTPGLDI